MGAIYNIMGLLEHFDKELCDDGIILNHQNGSVHHATPR